MWCDVWPHLYVLDCQPVVDVVELLAEQDGVGSVHEAAQQGLDLKPGDPGYLLVRVSSEVVSGHHPQPGVGPHQVVHHHLEPAHSPLSCLAQSSLQQG